MVDYYVGGGSAWSSGDDPTVWFNLDLDGHDSSLHATYASGDIEATDPFVLLTNTGTLVAPAPALFIGLSGDYHIKIDEAGISGFNPGSNTWTGLMGGVGGIGGAHTIINDTPTDGETLTGASSNWAYDHTQNPTDLNHLTDSQLGNLHSIYTLEQHDNDEHSTNYEAANANIQSHVANPSSIPSSHHTKYSDVNARAALGNIIGSDGHLDADLDGDGYGLVDLDRITFRSTVSAPIMLNSNFGSNLYHGVTISITNSIGSGYPVYISANNTCARSYANNAATMPCIGISVGTNTVLVWGVVYHTTFNTLVNGNPVYVTTAGVIDDAIPSSAGNVVQCMGVAIEPNAILVLPGLSWVVRS